MKKRNLVAILIAIVLTISSLSVVSGAKSYLNLPDEDVLLEDGIQPLYDIIHMIFLEPYEDGVEAIIETDWSAALQITIYRQNGSGWSMAAKKSYSKNGTGLAVFYDYDFEPGVTYKVVANYRADNERDTMEDVFSF